jgi:hypothetical protein
MLVNNYHTGVISQKNMYHIFTLIIQEVAADIRRDVLTVVPAIQTQFSQEQQNCVLIITDNYLFLSVLSITYGDTKKQCKNHILCKTQAFLLVTNITVA